MEPGSGAGPFTGQTGGGFGGRVGRGFLVAGRAGPVEEDPTLAESGLAESPTIGGAKGGCAVSRGARVVSCAESDRAPTPSEAMASVVRALRIG